MRKIISIILLCALFCTAFVGCSSKEIDRTKSAIYTDNFEITSGMLSYYFNVQYLAFLNTYGDNLEQIGLDTSKPLSEQTCSFSSNTNWYDYFMDIAKERLTQCLVISEQAKIEGKKLTKTELKEVTDLEKEILADAKEKDLSTEKYIANTFGDTVSLDDIIACTKMEKLTSKYYDNFISTLDTSEEAMEDYYEGHKKTYCTVDYLCFSFPIETSDQLEINKIHQKAIDLSESKSQEDFIKSAEDFLRDYYDGNYPNLSEIEADRMIDNAKKNMQVTNASYNGSSAASRWAFNDERVENQGIVIKNDEQKSYDVYYLTKLPTRDENKLTTIRQILIDPADYKNTEDAQSGANEILEQLKEAEFSKEAFVRLAAEYSTDTATATNGGLYERLTKGALKDAQEIEDWLFFEGRTVGDSTVIETKEYGLHIIYVEDQGDPVWLEQVRQGFQNARFEDYIGELSDEYMIYENNNIIYKITETDQSNFEPAA